MRGECEPAGALPTRPLFEKGFTAGTVGREVIEFKDRRLAEGPRKGKGVGLPPRALGVPGKGRM